MTEHETFTRILTPALTRPRVTLDLEGWPLVAGKYGRIEWRGAEPTGARRVHVYSDNARIIPKLRATPGARPAQIGDSEAVFSVAAEDMPALRACAALIQTKTRRAPETGRTAAELAPTWFKAGDRTRQSTPEPALVAQAAV